MTAPYDSEPPHSPSPGDPPPLVIPVRYAQAPPPRSSGSGSLFRLMLIAVLAGSIGLNLVLLLFSFVGSGDSGGSMREHMESGDPHSQNKIAVIKLEGSIFEGLNGFVQKQIDQAARDKKVKAVVFRIVSPGGSITGSDDMHRRLTELAQGKRPKQEGMKKPIIVSMGAVAASGGYYVAMPGEYLFAEPTTTTGSIGVYITFPNVAKLAENSGFSMNVIKAGEVKYSGSMFHKMEPQERQMWQDNVDHAFAQFISVVEKGRPALKGKMREVVIRRKIPVSGEAATGVIHSHADPAEANPFVALFGAEEPKTVEYVRRRADGGIYTADEAKKFGLIDAIGYEEDAVKKAVATAGLGEDYKVISYERQPSLANVLLGVQSSPPPASALDASRWADAACPRMWYLAPQSELSGILSVVGRRE